jgi:hypothetical protein
VVVATADADPAVAAETTPVASASAVVTIIRVP